MRRFVIVVTVLALLEACGGGDPSTDPASTAGDGIGAGDGPNVVLVLLDNLDETTSPYWEALPETRELIADRGTVFTNAFVSNPICCPTRASLLTGEYAHNTGVMTNGGPNGGWARFRGDAEERTFAIDLQEAGYRTALIGKYLNGYEAEPTFVPPGWDNWVVDVDTNLPNGFDYTLNVNGELREYGSADEDYNTDVFAEYAVDTIESFSGSGDPFFLLLAPTAPHVPIAAAPRHAEHPWVDASVPRSPNYDEADISDKPEWLRRSEVARRALEPWNDLDHQARMGSLLAVDEMVGSVVQALDEQGELEDTYVVFTSDNGYNLGSHLLIHMMAPYEESLRVPMAVAGPQVPEREEDRMVLLHDWAPTILELAGVEIPDRVDGRSLVPLLRGDDPGEWRSDFLAEYETGWAHRGFGWGLPAPEYFEQQILGGQDIPSYRAVRGERYVYIEWTYDDGSGERTEAELYDLETDPYQLDNLLATAEGGAADADLVAQLADRLADLTTCAGVSCR